MFLSFIFMSGPHFLMLLPCAEVVFCKFFSSPMAKRKISRWWRKLGLSCFLILKRLFIVNWYQQAKQKDSIFILRFGSSYLKQWGRSSLQVVKMEMLTYQFTLALWLSSFWQITKSHSFPSHYIHLTWFSVIFLCTSWKTSLKGCHFQNIEERREFGG